MSLLKISYLANENHIFRSVIYKKLSLTKVKDPFDDFILRHEKKIIGSVGSSALRDGLILNRWTDNRYGWEYMRSKCKTESDNVDHLTIIQEGESKGNFLYTKAEITNKSHPDIYSIGNEYYLYTDGWHLILDPIEILLFNEIEPGKWGVWLDTDVIRIRGFGSKWENFDVHFEKEQTKEFISLMNYRFGDTLDRKTYEYIGNKYAF
jgi:hypothetical protein